MDHFAGLDVSVKDTSGRGESDQFRLIATFRCIAGNFVRFSNRPVGVKHFQGYPPLQCRCLSRARASLRNLAPRPFHHGILGRGGTIFWGRPCRQCDGRSKWGKCGLYLIHRPARDIFPLLGGTRVFSYPDLIR